MCVESLFPPPWAQDAKTLLGCDEALGTLAVHSWGAEFVGFLPPLVLVFFILLCIGDPIHLLQSVPRLALSCPHHGSLQKQEFEFPC